MAANKPTPLCYRPPPPNCPICGKPSYSAAGMHPQCSARQLDADRMQRVRREAELEEKQAQDAPTKRPSLSYGSYLRRPHAPFPQNVEKRPS